MSCSELPAERVLSYKVPWLRPWALATGAALVFLVPAVGWAISQLPYDTEYEVIGYSTSPPTGSVARLQQKIRSGEVELRFDAERGYLASLLQQLKIPVASQMLVFSKTSIQTGLISSRTPRAIYFNDDVYVAWVQDSPVLEISALDPRLGPVFYTLSQKQGAPLGFQRETYMCLRCHDSYSLTGGGVPRYILGSGFADQSGQLVFHEGWHLTTEQTPLSQRWGGWYVTGTHGDQVHMGNLIPRNAVEAAQLDLGTGANLTDLAKLIDTTPYLGKSSDIVALMVVGHQIHLQNLITRVNYETRTALHKRASLNSEMGHEPDHHRSAATIDTMKGIQSVAEPLVRALLLVGEAPLTGPIAGTSGFAKAFVSQGPWDGRGRSLRQLDLTERLFRYPLSYLIYSEAFDALPGLVREYVYRRLREVLTGQDQGEEFGHLSDEDRLAILQILEDTKADFPGP